VWNTDIGVEKMQAMTKTKTRKRMAMMTRARCIDAVVQSILLKKVK
jgi:hypothetical protein